MDFSEFCANGIIDSANNILNYDVKFKIKLNNKIKNAILRAADEDICFNDLIWDVLDSSKFKESIISNINDILEKGICNLKE